MTNQEAWLYITIEDKFNDIKWRSTYLDENNSECVRRVQPELDIRLELMAVYEDNSTRIAHHLKRNIHSGPRVNQLLHFSNPTSSFCSSLSILQQIITLETCPAPRNIERSDFKNCCSIMTTIRNRLFNLSCSVSPETHESNETIQNQPGRYHQFLHPKALRYRVQHRPLSRTQDSEG